MKSAKAAKLDETGVLSLARACDNILMWSHYAANHTGLVIELDMLADPGFFATPINVRYQAAYVPTNYFIDPHGAVERTISTKSDAWSYESEVRIMKPSGVGAVSFNHKVITRVIFGCRATDSFIDEIKAVCSDESYAHVHYAKTRVAYGRFALEIDPI
jgi:hypothetical protein